MDRTMDASRAAGYHRVPMRARTLKAVVPAVLATALSAGLAMALALAGCAARPRGVEVLLDEAWVALYPDLARGLSGRPVPGVPVAAAAAALGRTALDRTASDRTVPGSAAPTQGARSGKVRRIIASPLVAASAGSGAPDSAVVVPAGFDFTGAYAKAGAAAGTRIASLRRSGSASARAVILFSPSSARPEALERVFADAFGAAFADGTKGMETPATAESPEALRTLRVRTDAAATGDPEGALRLALSSEMDGDVRLVMLAVDDTAFALSCPAQWPLVRFGFDTGMRDRDAVRDAGFAFLVGGRHADLARETIARVRRAQAGLTEARARAAMVGALR